MKDSTRQSLAVGERAGLRYALTTPRHAPAGTSGAVLSGRAGSSLEFREHRDYQPGDDLRHVDWNAYARTDQLSVKLYREEVTPHLDLLIDGSRSMTLEDSQKESATLALAAFFARSATNAGFSSVAWRLGGDTRRISPGAGGPLTWNDLEFTHVGPPGGVGASGPVWRPRGVRILISDLLWEGDPLETVRPFSERASVTLIVQVLAEADVNPPEGRSLRLVDVETGLMREIHTDALAVARYRAALARHQENWHAACRQVGALFVSVVAESILAGWDVDQLVAAGVLKVV
jgi:uncharacterized protein (DUF58 family)